MRGGTSARSTSHVMTTMPPTSSAMRSVAAPILVSKRALELAAHELADDRIGRVTDRRGRTAIEDVAAVEERDLVDEAREREHVRRYRDDGRVRARLIRGEQVVDL